MRSASTGCLVDSMVPAPRIAWLQQQSLPLICNMEPIDDAGIVLKAHHFFQTFRCPVLDLTLTCLDGEESQFFLNWFPIQYGEVSQSFLDHPISEFLLLCTKGPKGDYKEVDRIIAYVLLVMALGLETISIVLLISSDWTFIWLEGLSGRNVSAAQILRIVSYFKLPVRSLWSNCMSQDDLLSSCLRN